MTAAPVQFRLNLSILDPVRLCTVETARVALGCDAETVMARIEAGLIQFAFNLSTGTSKREVRIWTGCFDPDLDPEDMHTRWKLDDVIANALGTTPKRLAEEKTFTVNGSWLETKWCVSNWLVQRMDIEKFTVGKTTKLSRRSAAAFLRDRVIT